MNITTFEELNIRKEIQMAVTDMGYIEPTEIQLKTIPLIMEGVDVIGHSQTGSGKTAAFGIPAIQQINSSYRGTQVLILCPTRELAMQASDEMRKFTKYLHGIKTIPIYGGQPIDRQIRALKSGAQIVIGTPGRVIDHINRRTLKLKNLKLVVLDEADEMLNMGFREDIEKILQHVPEERQTVLFSATMSKEILAITHKYQKKPKLIKIAQKQLTVSSIQQYYYDVPRGKKTETLCRLLDVCDADRSMVFCNTKKQVDELVSELQRRGISVDGLHGDMKQQSRNLVMGLFKGGKIGILVATDVAARGIDVDDIECVYNYDLPQDIEYYVHRIGRTGRAGKEGISHTFITGRKQLYWLREIQKFTKSKIKQKAIPSLAEVSSKNDEKFAERVLEVLKKEDLSEEISVVDKLLHDGYTSSEVAAALIRIINGEKKRESTHVVPEEYINSMPTFKGQARIKLHIGKSSKIAAKHIVGAIAGESGIAGKEIGKIEIFDDFTIVNVPEDKAQDIVTAMQNSKINGKFTKVELA